MQKRLFLCLLLAAAMVSVKGQKKLTEYVNPFLGTATLWEPEDLGYVRKMQARTWGAEGRIYFYAVSNYRIKEIQQQQNNRQTVSLVDFNAIGLYTYSPAEPSYIVSVPLFDTAGL